MTHLPSLIRKIDDFYSLSNTLMRLVRLAAPTTWTMPDDPDEDEKPEQTPEEYSQEIYNRVMDKIEAISSEGNDYKYDDVADMLRRAAALYKKSVEINGGFQRMLNPKNGYLPTLLAEIFSTIDEIDGPEGEDVKDAADDIIEEMVSDLREKAKGSILGQTDEATADKSLRDINRGFFAEEARKEPEQQRSVYERGKPGAETSHTTGPSFTPETPQKYQQQLESLMEQYKATTDQKTRDDLLKLMTVSKDMMDQLKVVRSLMDQLKITPDDKDVIAKLEAATNSLDSLKDARRAIKRQMANSILGHQKHRLQEAYDAARDPREQAWLQQKMKLLDLQMDDKLLRKRDELRAMRSYINAMGVIDEHGDFQSLHIPDLERMSYERAIQLGHTKTLTKADYDRQRTEQKALLEGRKAPEKRTSQRGGWAPGEKQTNLDISMYNPKFFKIHAGKVGPAVNTAVAGASYYIAREKEGGQVALKPLIEEISKAIRKKDEAAKHAAIAKLREEAKKYILTKNPQAVASYEVALRLAPFFRKVAGLLDEISTFQNENGTWNMDEAQRAKVKETVVYLSRLIDIYNSQYGHKRTNFNSLAKNSPDSLLPKLKSYLENIVLNEAYSTGIRVETEQPKMRVLEPTPEATEEPEEDIESEMKKRMRLRTQLLYRVLQKTSERV